jgi:hypothetical protein
LVTLDTEYILIWFQLLLILYVDLLYYTHSHMSGKTLLQFCNLYVVGGIK